MYLDNFGAHNGSNNSIFLKILGDFDNFMQNKTCKCIEMWVFTRSDCFSSESRSFWFKIREEKNFTIARRFAIVEHESLHYCETLLYFLVCGLT